MYGTVRSQHNETTLFNTIVIGLKTLRNSQMRQRGLIAHISLSTGIKYHITITKQNLLQISEKPVLYAFRLSQRSVGDMHTAPSLPHSFSLGSLSFSCSMVQKLFYASDKYMN